MSDTPAAAPVTPARSRHAWLGNGGYVLVIAAVLVAIIVSWRLAVIIGSGGARATGDGQHPDTYGFDLSGLQAPRETLVGSGRPKDGLAAFTAPPHVRADDIATINGKLRGKYLVSSDRVIGVQINGDACAFPVRVLQWHEVVNDTVGGVPVLVSWSSFTDSACVMERRLPDGDVPEFGFSGLLSNAVSLVYDRRADAAAESLWNPLAARAVAGPAAGTRLRVFHAQLVSWEWWHRQHPATRVMVPPASGDAPDLARWIADGATSKPDIDKRYARDPFQTYYANPDKLPAPVAPSLPPGTAPKEGVVRVELTAADGTVTASADWPYAEVGGGESHAPVTREVMLGDVPLRLTWLPSLVGRPCVAVEVDLSRLPATADIPELRVRHAFRFAWHALDDASSRGNRQPDHRN